MASAYVSIAATVGGNNVISWLSAGGLERCTHTGTLRYSGRDQFVTFVYAVSEIWHGTAGYKPCFAGSPTSFVRLCTGRPYVEENMRIAECPSVTLCLTP